MWEKATFWRANGHLSDEIRLSSLVRHATSQLEIGSAERQHFTEMREMILAMKVGKYASTKKLKVRLTVLSYSRSASKESGVDRTTLMSS